MVSEGDWITEDERTKLVKQKNIKSIRTANLKDSDKVVVEKIEYKEKNNESEDTTTRKASDTSGSSDDSEDEITKKDLTEGQRKALDLLQERGFDKDPEYVKKYYTKKGAPVASIPDDEKRQEIQDKRGIGDTVETDLNQAEKKLEDQKEKVKEKPTDSFVIGDKKVSGKVAEGIINDKIKNIQKLQTAYNNPSIEAKRKDDEIILIKNNDLDNKTLSKNKEQNQSNKDSVEVSEELSSFIRQEENLSMPENRKQKEIAEQLMRVQEYKESGGGFTESEKRIVEQGQKDIERAENTLKAKNYLRNVDRKIQNIEESETYTVDGEKVSGDQLKDKLKSKKEELGIFIDNQDYDSAEKLEQMSEDKLEDENKVLAAKTQYEKIMPEKEAKGAAQIGWGIADASKAVGEGLIEQKRVIWNTLPNYKILTDKLEELTGIETDVSMEEIKETGKELFDASNMFQKGVQNVLPLDEMVEEKKKNIDNLKIRKDYTPTEYSGTYGKIDMNKTMKVNAGEIIEKGIGGEMPVVGADMMVVAGGLPTLAAGTMKQIQEKGGKGAAEQLGKDLKKGGSKQLEGLSDFEELSAEVVFEGAGLLMASPVIPTTTTTTTSVSSVASSAGRTTVNIQSSLQFDTSTADASIPSYDKIPYMGEKQTTAPTRGKTPYNVQRDSGIEVLRAGDNEWVGDPSSRIQNVELGSGDEVDVRSRGLEPDDNIVMGDQSKKGFSPEEQQVLKNKRSDDVDVDYEFNKEGKIEKASIEEKFEQNFEDISRIDRIKESFDLSKKRKGQVQLEKPFDEISDIKDSFIPDNDLLDVQNDVDMPIIDDRPTADTATSSSSTETSVEKTTEVGIGVTNPVTTDILTDDFEDSFEQEEVEESPQLFFEEETEETGVEKVQEIVQVEEERRVPDPTPVEQPENFEEPRVEPNQKSETSKNNFLDIPDFEFEDERMPEEEKVSKDEPDKRDIPDDYMPSLGAAVFDIEAEEAPEDLTGLEIRPIIDEEEEF